MFEKGHKFSNQSLNKIDSNDSYPKIGHADMQELYSLIDQFTNQTWSKTTQDGKEKWKLTH